METYNFYREAREEAEQKRREAEQKNREIEDFTAKIGRELDAPLAQVTRAERRNLIVASAIGLFVFYTELIPKKIEFLGVTFEAGEQELIPFSIGLVVAYFGLSFLTFAAFDLVQFQRHQKAARRYHQMKRKVRVEIIKALRESQSTTSFVPGVGQEHTQWLIKHLDYVEGTTSSAELDQRFAARLKTDPDLKNEYDELRRRLELAADRREMDIEKSDRRRFEIAYWLNWSRAIVDLAIPITVAIWSVRVLLF